MINKQLSGWYLQQIVCIDVSVMDATSYYGIDVSLVRYLQQSMLVWFAAIRGLTGHSYYTV